MRICSRRINERLCVLGVFLCMFLLNAVVGVQGDYPNIMDDELGTQAIAAFFVGENWSSYMSGGPYYGYGQALFYVPIYAIISDPAIRGMCVGVVNALITALIFPIAYVIFKRQLNFCVRHALIYAVFAAIFPSYTLYSKYMWNEVMLGLLPWLVLCVLLELSQNQKFCVCGSIMLAFLSVYAYAVHGRGIALFVVVCIVIIGVWVLQRRLLISIIPFILTLIFVYSIHKFLYTKLITELWLIPPGGTIGNTMGSMIEKMASFAGLESMINLLRGMSSVAFVVVCSTFGMIGFFVVYIVKLFGKFLKDDKLQSKLIRGQLSENTDQTNWHIATWYTTLFLICACSISVLFLNGMTGDYLIYTRYYANAMGMVAVFAFVILHQKLMCKDDVLPSLLFNIFSLACVLLIAKDCGFSRIIIYLNVYPFLNVGGGYELLTISIVIAIVVTLITITIYYCRIRWCYFILAILSVYSYGFTVKKHILPVYAGMNGSVGVVEKVINSYEGLYEHFNHVIVSESNRYPIAGRLQYALPKFQIYYSSSEKNEYEFEDNSIIVTTESIMLSDYVKDCYQLLDKQIDKSGMKVWVYGDEIKNFMTQEYGVVFSDPYAEQLTYDLGEQENYTIIDYSGNEKTFRWTTGLSSIMARLDGTHSYQMNIAISHLPNLKTLNRQSFEFSVLVNGQICGTFELLPDKSLGEVSVIVDKTILKKGISLNQITIESDTWSPSEYGAADNRTLGIAIDKIEFERIV